MTSNNNNTKTSKHRCRVFIKKKFLNEFKLTVWNMLNTYSWIIFDVVWTKIIRCQITCSRPYEFNFHFFGNIYFNYHPMFGNSKNSSLPTQPLTVSKKNGRKCNKIFNWVSRFQRLQIFFSKSEVAQFLGFYPICTQPPPTF